MAATRIAGPALVIAIDQGEARAHRRGRNVSAEAMSIIPIVRQRVLLVLHRFDVAVRAMVGTLTVTGMALGVSDLCSAAIAGER